MATFRLEVVTAERMVFSDDVNEAVAWGVEGQLGILPHHTPLMTMLQAGELLIRRGEEEQYLAISGGFLEVRSDKVVILADGCERAEEIDTARAEAARRRAQETLSTGPAGVHDAAAEAALRRSLARLKVAGRKRHRPKGWL
ncbi:MAG: F0F1 ATP synthase subunit epsilon [Dehalococcoidia bacterium]|nr:F0F1 ATP synthase subunit epsilon [Dehalococcoidia bacterium]MCK4262713.1 F0F1 ATP synthase subunit epsilon [Dehalococcoidia bacterium]MCK4581587.1 F0F1 ATP synthase subunit epsilon [Dehalococcoidia bacterium]